MRGFKIALVFSLCLITSAPVRAGGLEGSDDPILEQAISDWLKGEDLPPLRSIAALAQQNNPAARILLSKLNYRHRPPDVLNLTTDARRALFNDTSEHRFGRSWQSVEKNKGNEFAIALSGIYQFKDIKEWLKHADILMAAGEREAVLRVGDLILVNHFDRAVLDLLEPLATPADHIQSSIWDAKWIESRLFRMGDDELGEISDRAKQRWQSDPWTEVDEAAVRAAYEEGWLSAIKFQWIREIFEASVKENPPLAYSKHQRSGQLIVGPFVSGVETSSPTVKEMNTAGKLLITEAERGANTLPILSICQEHCSDSVPLCVYAAYVELGGPGGLAEFRTPLESVIPQQRWLKSERAKIELLEIARSMRNAESLNANRKRLESWPLDQCFMTLAEEQHSQSPE